MNETKIKIGGIKYKVRLVGDDEIITSHMLHAIPWELAGLVFHDDSFMVRQREYYLSTGKWEELKFVPSECVGGRTTDHLRRIYVEVLSKFYNPGIPLPLRRAGTR